VKFFIDNIWLILLALVSGGALLWPTLFRSKNTLSTLQATQLLNQDKVTILDVRTSDEFKGGHLKDSKHIPLDQLSARCSELNKSHPVLVVCAVGGRAARGASLLKSAGFDKVYVLGGGFNEWRSQGLPTAK
jgi:rhodanese-related sulfurtransferase